MKQRMANYEQDVVEWTRWTPIVHPGWVEDQLHCVVVVVTCCWRLNWARAFILLSTAGTQRQGHSRSNTYIFNSWNKKISVQCMWTSMSLVSDLTLTFRMLTHNGILNLFECELCSFSATRAKLIDVNPQRPLLDKLSRMNRLHGNLIEAWFTVTKPVYMKSELSYMRVHTKQGVTDDDGQLTKIK